MCSPTPLTKGAGAQARAIGWADYRALRTVAKGRPLCDFQRMMIPQTTGRLLIERSPAVFQEDRYDALFSLLVGLFLLAILVGCGGAADVPTVGPTPTPTPQPTPVPPTPMPIAALGGRTLHSVCLSVEQDYPHEEVLAYFQPPIAEMAARLIRASGVQVFDEANACEATLFIGLTGEAVGGSYGSVGWCNTGAEYEGKIVLTSTNGESVVVPVQGVVEPAGAIVGGCQGGIEDTPFDQAATRALLDGLASIWGRRMLVSSLGHGSLDFPVFMVAQEELLAMGDDAIPLLIEGLSHGDPGTRKDAALVLCEFGPRASPAVPALIHNLDDEHQGPPKSVQTSPPGVVPVRWKHFPWRNVRMAAVEALRDIGPGASEAVSSLIQILEEEDSARNRPAIREIVWALEGITGQELGEDPAVWKEYWEQS